MTSRELSREIALKIEQLGVGGTIKRIPRKLAQHVSAWFRRDQQDEFDLAHNTDTGGVISVGSLDLPDEAMKHAVRYQTAITNVFLSLITELPIRHEEYIFIDLGSGKGRALLLASAFPFKSIIGVELAPSLHKIACDNISIYRIADQRCRNLVSVCGNVANYDLPNDNLVLYLFNPFDSQVMETLVSRIEASLQRFARSVYVVYLKPLHRTVFDRSAFLEVKKATDQYVIYESKAAL